MIISLIVGTLNRKVELERFLESLEGQTYKDFEVIIVDQNKDGKLLDIIEKFRDSFPIIHCNSDRGFSKAKNVGVKYANGQIIAFPDDDCWYMSDTLSKVIQHFLDNPSCSGVCGKTVDHLGITSLNKFADTTMELNRENLWHLIGSQTVFLKSTLDMIIGEHDETLGVGADTIWQSCEDIDYTLRGIESGAKIVYFPDIIIGHPQVDQFSQDILIDRVKKYTPGTGRVMRKHHYPLIFMIKRIYRPFIGSILYSVINKRDKALYYREIWSGILKGWRS